MSDQERPLIDRVWEFTKDISVKVSRKAEKHWKINTLRVEIASIRHRINVKYKELGRYVYESVKSQTLEEDSYKASLREFFDELKRLEGEILQRENRIEILEQEMREASAQSKQPPPFPGEAAQAEIVDAEVVSETEVTETDTAETEASSPQTAEGEATPEESEPDPEAATDADAEPEEDSPAEEDSDDDSASSSDEEADTPEATTDQKEDSETKPASSSKDKESTP